MSNYFKPFVIATTGLIGLSLAVQPVSASRHRVGRTVAKGALAYGTYKAVKGHSNRTSKKTSNGQSQDTANQEAMKPLLAQYAPNATYSNGAYVLKSDNGLDAKVSSAPYVSLSNTDNLGRAGVANALLNKTTRQTVTRDKTGNAGTIQPVGYKQTKIGNKYVYNRGHLIGYALAGKLKSFDASEANRNNIITQTAWANQSQKPTARGQLYYETLVRKALDKNQTVRYRVTPLYQGNELVARGTLLQAKSRDGKLNFNVIVPNAQAGATIDYNTGNVQ